MEVVTSGVSSMSTLRLLDIVDALQNGDSWRWVYRFIVCLKYIMRMSGPVFLGFVLNYWPWVSLGHIDYEV